MAALDDESDLAKIVGADICGILDCLHNSIEHNLLQLKLRIVLLSGGDFVRLEVNHFQCRSGDGLFEGCNLGERYIMGNDHFLLLKGF